MNIKKIAYRIICLSILIGVLAACSKSTEKKKTQDESAIKEKFKQGFEYTWYPDGSCKSSSDQVCISLEDYKYLCLNSDGASKWANTLATASWYDHVASHLYENGGFQDNTITWRESAQTKCRLGVVVAGIYQGSSWRKMIDAGVSKFIVNSDNKIIVTNANPISY